MDEASVHRLEALPLHRSTDDGERARSGFRSLNRTTRIGAGVDTFARARDDLFTWQVQARAGVRVDASRPTVMLDGVAVVSIGLGPVRIGGPVRVVDVIDRPARAGFTYAALPGHPELGEESFHVVLDGDGVRFELFGRSKPAGLLARFGGPISTLVQRVITDRYARALAE
ncbi:DUF1990 family protein [Gordonia sp. (in: high G+C Gram-positive bacteria)]|uniref:DUF1990 family protein n=1 Tax=Gordonia sp. (in: high G+C Gram-positive bacteria) TaxID=84139 RepID=UPI003F9EB1F1